MSGPRQLTIRQSAIHSMVLQSGVMTISPLIALILEYELECRSLTSNTSGSSTLRLFHFHLNAGSFMLVLGSLSTIIARKVCSMVVLPSKPGTHLVVYGDQDWEVFQLLVIPSDGSAVGYAVLPTPNVKFDAAGSFLTAHPDPIAPGALYLANSNAIWYRDANSAMSVVAGGSHGKCMDGVGEAARFAGILGLLSTRDGRTLFVADHRNGRVRSISFETAGSKVGTVITIAGNGQAVNKSGTGVKAGLFYPREMLWISDAEQTEMLVSCGYQINRLNPKTRNHSLVA